MSKEPVDQARTLPAGGRWGSLGVAWAGAVIRNP
jgi:hypothetical protein